MRAMVTVITALIVTLSSIAIPGAQERHTHPPGTKPTGLGVVAFANSGAPAAQEPFLRGLALLHSFEYEEAAEGFRQAQQADPAFAMAFWAEAVTYSHLLWGEDDVAAARRALSRLGSTRDARLAKAGTPRERAYGAAVEALFAESDLPARVRGFADAMRQVAATYPDDLDAAAFTSLALMFAEYVGQLPSDQRTAARADAIAFAERVFRTDPRHPGGTHYLIHATDDPALASRGLDAARLYAKIAPDAEHALHMPSHIFRAAWSAGTTPWRRTSVPGPASKAEVAARKLSNADLSFHALQWLQYGYLQQGRYRAARDLIDTARADLAGVDLNAALHVDARYTVGWLEFVHAANTGEWSGEVCRQGAPSDPQVGSSDRERSFHALAAYRRAVAPVMCGLGDGAVAAIRARVDALPATDSSERTLRTALLHARLALYASTGSANELETLLADTSEPARAPVGPPATLRTEELLGAARLKAGRPHEAVAAYERALRLTPNRSAALSGSRAGTHCRGQHQRGGGCVSAAARQLAPCGSRPARACGSEKRRRGEITHSGRNLVSP